MTDVTSLVDLIERTSGIVVPERDLERLEALATEIAARRTGGDLGQLVSRLRRHRGGRDWRTLLAAITVKESYLFRSPRQFDALAEAVLPELVRRRPERRLAVWSAGCARGEEAATIAMVLAASPLLAGWTWRVLATDIDEDALDEAREGRFGRRAVARVPASMRERFLQQQGGSFLLAGFLRRRIDFQRLNVVDATREVPGAPFDIILLRNVLIYFRPETQGHVVRNVAGALADDGFLFLGASESLLQQDVPVQPVELGDCFVYRRQTGVPAENAVAPAASTPAIRSVAVPSSSPAPHDSSRAARASSPKPTEDPAVTVRSLLLAGSIGRAAASGSEYSQREPDNIELRALTALAIDAVGDDEAAVRAYRAVLYLEPTLFQIRHRLASVLERQGNLDRAAAELGSALTLISSGRGRTLAHWRELGLDDAEAVARACRSALRD